MVRPWLIGVLALGLALPGCKKKPLPAPSGSGPPEDSLGLVPADALTVGGIDLSGLMSTELWRRRQAQILAEGRATVKVLEACELDLSRWRRLTLGIGTTGYPQAMTVVIEAEGVGKPQTLDCVAARVAEGAVGKAPPWTRGADGVLRAADGRVGYVVSDDRVVVTDGHWAPQVEALIKGTTVAGPRGAVDTALGSTDRSKPVWFSGVFPPAAKAMLGAVGDIGEPQHVAGWLNMVAGLELRVAVGFGDAAAAERAEQSARSALTNAKAEGLLPAVLVDAVSFGVEGSVATVSATISLAQIEQMAGRQAPIGPAGPPGQ